MEKIITFEPAFDKRDKDPSKNYGIHSVTLRMVLKGELGAVHFVLYTGWNLPHVTEEMRHKMSPNNHFLFEPQPCDLGYHSPKPLYEDQYKHSNCPYLNGKDCYCDGSALNSNRIYKILLEKGCDGVWKALEEYYTELFNELK